MRSIRAAAYVRLSRDITTPYNNIGQALSCLTSMVGSLVMTGGVAILLMPDGASREAKIGGSSPYALGWH